MQIYLDSVLTEEQVHDVLTDIIFHYIYSTSLEETEIFLSGNTYFAHERSKILLKFSRVISPSDERSTTFLK